MKKSKYSKNGNCPNCKILISHFRHIMLEKLKKHVVNEDSCTLCFDDKACMKILPCHHDGLCFNCAVQLESCPMCRGPISKLLNLNEESQ